VREHVLEEEAVLVDLCVEEVEELLGRDDVVGEGACAGGGGGVVVVVVEVPLALLLVDLLYHGQ
jgi:hypothetical protein